MCITQTIAAITASCSVAPQKCLNPTKLSLNVPSLSSIMVTTIVDGGVKVLGLVTDAVTLKVSLSSSTESPSMVIGWHPVEVPSVGAEWVSI